LPKWFHTLSSDGKEGAKVNRGQATEREEMARRTARIRNEAGCLQKYPFSRHGNQFLNQNSKPMKNLAFCLVICLSAFVASAQNVPVSRPLPVKFELGVPTVVESGAHDRVWQTFTIGEAGQTNVSSFTEAATGLNFWNPASGRYDGSEERFQIAKDGSAIATNGQHQVILAADINSGGSVDLLMPDGQRLLSNPMGLSFFDSSSGKNVLIAEITNCVGQLVAPNVVLYQNAFDTIKASLRYTYMKSGFSQDVLIHENPGSPADYGLNPDTTVLEMYSEFYNPPTPTIESGLGGDQILNLSQMQVGHGVAYVMNSTLEPVNVSKTWTDNWKKFPD